MKYIAVDGVDIGRMIMANYLSNDIDALQS